MFNMFKEVFKKERQRKNRIFIENNYYNNYYLFLMLLSLRFDFENLK